MNYRNKRPKVVIDWCRHHLTESNQCNQSILQHPYLAKKHMK